MVVVENVKAWVNSVGYNDVLKNVCERLYLKVNHESQPDIVWQLDVEKLNLAGLNIDDISAVTKNYELVAEYVKKKLTSSKINPDEQEGREPDDDDVEVHPFYKSF